MRSPILHEALAAATFLGDPVGFRVNHNRLRHYERISGGPGNLIVFGDALVEVNPLLGQGMSLAVIGAQLLERYLRAGVPLGTQAV